jgi:hypothetical protein
LIVGGAVKNVYQVLRDKELELQRVRTEVAALQTVIPLLTDSGEWFDKELFVSSHPNEGDHEKSVVQKPA